MLHASSVVMVYVWTTVQESGEISQLQQENAELRQALDDHQSAIELIMSRYRSRVSRLVAANRHQRAQFNTPENHSQVLCWSAFSVLFQSA